MNGSSRAWTGLVLVAGGLLAVPEAGGGCYKQQWFNTYQTGDACALYTVCPKKVLCNVAATGNKHTGVITTQQVACTTYANGQGTPGSCTGGTPTFPPAMVVSVHYQECTGSCP